MSHTVNLAEIESQVAAGISVGLACRAGLRGLPRPLCMRQFEFAGNPLQSVHKVPLAAKISGRKDLL